MNKITPFNKDIAIVSRASNRDTYRIGVGIDLVNLIQSLKKPK